MSQRFEEGRGKFSRTPGEINRLVECFIVTGNIPWEINMFKNKVGAVSWFCQNVCVFFFPENHWPWEVKNWRLLTLSLFITSDCRIEVKQDSYQPTEHLVVGSLIPRFINHFGISLIWEETVVSYAGYVEIDYKDMFFHFQIFGHHAKSLEKQIFSD